MDQSPDLHICLYSTMVSHISWHCTRQMPTSEKTAHEQCGCRACHLIATGIFTAPMGFQTFPADQQSLPVTIYLVHDDVHSMTRSQLVLLPLVTLSTEILQRRDLDEASTKDMLSGWDIVDAVAQELPRQDLSTQVAVDDPGAFGHCATRHYALTSSCYVGLILTTAAILLTVIPRVLCCVIND